MANKPIYRQKIRLLARRFVVFLVGTATSVASSSDCQAAAPAFVDRTQAAGLLFVHGPLETTPGSKMTGGGSVGDFNNDGWPDLFVVGGGDSTDRLFINQGDGTFVDEAAAWGLTDAYRGNGANAADYDGDGWTDLFVTSLGDLPGEPQNGFQKLYRNNGNGSFTDVAQPAGVAWTSPIADGFGVTWGDYDLDGDLDLWTGGWIDLGQTELSGGTRLFQNNGDGTFSPISEEAGVFDPTTRGFGAVFVDMDGDRYPELLVAGDFGTSRYYSNRRDGTFRREDPTVFGGARVYAGMGTTVGDFDRDGLTDWFVTAIFRKPGGPDGNRLYLNGSNRVGQHTLEALPESAGINDGGWGWGTVALDFDHDGWLDLLHTNGWSVPDCSYPEDGCYADEPSYLFRSLADGTYAEVGREYGVDHTLQGRGVIHFDPDRDGDMDVVIFSNGDQLTYFRNELTGDDIHWVKVRLDTSADPSLAPHGLGSLVRIQIGDQVQTHRMHAGSNYLSRSELVAHFGLGAAATIDELIVEWPNGFRERLANPAVDTEYTVSASLPLTTGPLVRGQTVELTLAGLRPREVARFVGTAAGTGAGPCLERLAGRCVDLLAPNVLGDATADATGRAVLTLSLPIDFVPEKLALQAVVERGEGGFESLVSNVVTAPVVDP